MIPNTLTTAPLVTISIESQYLIQQSDPAQAHYVFSYTVTIHNESDEEVQLLGRHWIITDGDDLSTEEVHGDGVIGVQPKIKPNESYCYTSGSIMHSPVGTMHGSYRMITSQKQAFDVEIKAFTLATEHQLH